MKLASTLELRETFDIRSGQIVAVIGAGGKHTLMHRLSQELAAVGLPVVLTSTTNLHRNAELSKLGIIVVDECDNWAGKLRETLSNEMRAIVVGSRLGANMYRGIDGPFVSKLVSTEPSSVVLVKADGARRRLLKVPGEQEPVYPPRTNVCVLVLSLASIGKPITDQHVHRLERLQALTVGDTITKQTLLDVLQPGGYGDRMPGSARHMLYLSSCHAPSGLDHAQFIFEHTSQLFHVQACGDTISGLFYIATADHV